VRRLLSILDAGFLFRDNFNRADGALGSPWTVFSGAFSIESNRLKCVSGGGAGVTMAKNVSLEAAVTIGTTEAYLTVRRVDSANRVEARLFVDKVRLLKLINSVSTVIQDVGITYVAGKKVKLIANGNLFSIFYDGLLKISPTVIPDAVLQTSSIVGVVGTTNSYFDDFVVRRV